MDLYERIFNMKTKHGCIFLALLLALFIVKTADAGSCASKNCAVCNIYDFYLDIDINKSTGTFTGEIGWYVSIGNFLCCATSKNNAWGTIDFHSKTGVLYTSIESGTTDNFTVFSIQSDSFWIELNASGYQTKLECSSHPSCPEIYSWNGEEYQFAGSLFTRTHSPESEFYQDQIISPVVPQGDTLDFLIKEIDREESYVNSVGMFYRYVWAPSDDWQSLPLLSAVHNRDGNVMESLLEKDDKRVYLIPGDEILVQYAFPPAGLGGIEFSSVASGYYLWSHETWCEVLALGRQLHVTSGDTVTLRAYINNMSTKVLPDDAIVRFALEDDPDTTVGSVSAAGLAPGDSQWYLLEWTTPEDFTAGAYSYRASIFLGESDITWKPEYYPTFSDESATEKAKDGSCN